VFTSAIELPKISVTSPNVLTVLRPADGISLQWTPPAMSPDTELVAVILKSPPRRVSGANRIANPSDLVWIWSTTAPGENTLPGRVPLNAGHGGLDAQGGLGVPYARSTLAEGRYWWFVYGIRRGVVTLASDVLSFRVGSGGPQVSCARVDDCVRQIVGELPDTVACIAGTCRRRCASNFDCPGSPNTCDFVTTLVPTVVSERPPRGGYCAL
jgi:hypothetical protein